MPNIHPDEHSHGIDLEAALEFLNTLHPGHGRTDDQHERDEHLERPSDAAAWFLEYGLIHPDAGIRIGDAEEGEDPDRQDDCDVRSHPAPPFFFRNPLIWYLWLLLKITLLCVTCQAV